MFGFIDEEDVFHELGLKDENAVILFIESCLEKTAQYGQTVSKKVTVVEYVNDNEPVILSGKDMTIEVETM